MITASLPEGGVAAAGYDRCEELARDAARAARAGSHSDDIVQDCLLHVAENPELLDSERFNDSFLFSRFRWRAVNYLRRQDGPVAYGRAAEEKSPEPSPRRERGDSRPWTNALGETVLSGHAKKGEPVTCDPETYVMRKWTCEFCLWLAGVAPLPSWGISPEARAAFDALPAPDATTRRILRRWMTGESQEKIAVHLGISQQAVSKRIANRVSEVKGYLEHCLPDLLAELHEIAA